MKTNKFLTIILILAFGSQSFFSLAASDSEKTENRNVESFSTIEVSSGIDLFLKQGDAEKVVVKADEDIIDDIVTRVKDGVLKIYMKEKHGWSWKNWNHKRDVYVTVIEIDGLKASSGSDIESEGMLVQKNMKIKASSGSDVDLELKADKVMLETSSGSDAKLVGRANYLEASSSSGSDLNASDFEVKECRVSASSGSDASVFVTERIKADASSGGDIYYRGNPERKDINESSGGDVHRR